MDVLADNRQKSHSRIQTAKEVAKEFLTRVGLYDAIRKMMGKDLGFKDLERLEDRFSYTYDKERWKLGNPDVPSSGTGSTLAATENLRNALPDLLQSLKTKALLDLGCGDFHWMQTIDLGEIEYIGADLVKSVIDANTAKFSSGTRRFVLANAVSDPLPDADTVMCREVLFHLSFNDIRAVLKNILATNRNFVALTTDRISGFNSDITSGDYRLLNLEAAPFYFPSPMHFIQDSVISQRGLGVWEAKDLRLALNL